MWDMQGWWPDVGSSGLQTQDLPSPFDGRAMAVVEGAIAQGILPPAGPSLVDLRAMPPNLAQAYFLTALAVMQRSLLDHRYALSFAGNLSFSAVPGPDLPK